MNNVSGNLAVVFIAKTKCGVSECDHESSTMRWPWPSRLLRHSKKIIGNKTKGYIKFHS
jgi:hypothetical protein